jgi:hypothetical protein
MAVPTITSVTPSTVWTGGQLVVVTGTNLRLPPDPPVSATGPLPDPLPTVGVLVGSVEAKAVDVLSATMLSCNVPAADPSPAPVAMVVRNLDDAGVPIPGESATLAAAVTSRTSRAFRARRSSGWAWAHSRRRSLRPWQRGSGQRSELREWEGSLQAAPHPNPTRKGPRRR